MANNSRLAGSSRSGTLEAVNQRSAPRLGGSALVMRPVLPHDGRTQLYDGGVMATWAEFAAQAPTIAAAGRDLIYRTETGQALLSTVRGDEPPRIHPIYVALLDDRLVAFILRSAKAADLAEDGRYALHVHQDPAQPHEFLVRGRARPIDDEATRADMAAAWYFEVDDTNRLFEFLVDHAVLGERASADDWPPRYTSWRDTGG